MHLIIDIGNSKVKYYSENTEIKSINELRSPLDILLISSVPELNQAELDKLADFEIEGVLVYKPLRDSNLKNIYPSIGADRVAKLEGALALNPGKDVILIDFGTATTLSAASADYDFIGGYIAAGFKTSLRALAECSQLPDLSEFKSLSESTELSMTTEQAMLAGSYQAHQAMIRTWIANAQQRIPDAVLLCTGGLAECFEADFSRSIPAAELLCAIHGMPCDLLQG